MAIGPGDTLPEAKLAKMGADGPEVVDLNEMGKGKKLAIFALPGAFTGTCSTAHVPSFIRTIDDLKAKGVDEVICVSVNDVFVMQAWGEQTGATEAGIQMLADGDGSFTKAMGRDFSAPPVGLIDRSKRYAMVVEDGKIVTLQEEENPGVCDVSGGEAILETL
ncbi:peroxiredoxin [Neptunicoccus cionae]|uniref:peroxiredoxin n=1 Tax=Neptunicoccus cionae TaxID=2035344 RepID=UPI000C756381|nr:peroxiredoxin [Amylibacter cionae]PLS23019.1 peroxiredoxin [Amylibacter cionae]